jgi:hypothetical protein
MKIIIIITKVVMKNSEFSSGEKLNFCNDRNRGGSSRQYDSSMLLSVKCKNGGWLKADVVLFACGYESHEKLFPFVDVSLIDCCLILIDMFFFFGLIW